VCSAQPLLLYVQEPLCSLIFNPSAVRDGFPCCHAYYSSRDNCDLIVGIANGEGELQLDVHMLLGTASQLLNTLIAVECSYLGSKST
jgi:hypothetical protein